MILIKMFKLKVGSSSSYVFTYTITLPTVQWFNISKSLNRIVLGVIEAPYLP